MILDEDASNAFQEAMKQIEDEQEVYWSKLTKEEQLKAFCCVVRRLHHGEFVDKRSYRGILYDVFEFGPESYIQAQDAGFLALHNSIFDGDEFHSNLIKFAVENNIDEDKMKDFITRYYHQCRNTQ